MALSVAQGGAQSLCGSCGCSPSKQLTQWTSTKYALPCTTSSRVFNVCATPACRSHNSYGRLCKGKQSLTSLKSANADALLALKCSLSKRKSSLSKRSVSPRAENSSWSQGIAKAEQSFLTLLDVRLTLAPAEDLIPVARRLPAPKDTGVYALVPTSLLRQEGSDDNTSGVQPMSREDAMGFALSAATGNRSGPIAGPGWTLLDPAAALGSRSFSSAGPLLSSSPRRTLRVEFTCNKCWERTIRAINPQAYKSGTVFVQCKGCNVYHKLVDNLKLFHELKGPIYSPPGHLFHTPYDPFQSGMTDKGFDGLPFQ